MLQGARRSQLGPQPAHYSAGELIWKDSDCVPVSKATAQTVWRRAGQCPGLPYIKFLSRVYWEGRGHRKKQVGFCFSFFLRKKKHNLTAY